MPNVYGMNFMDATLKWQTVVIDPAANPFCVKLQVWHRPHILSVSLWLHTVTCHASVRLRLQVGWTWVTVSNGKWKSAVCAVMKDLNLWVCACMWHSKGVTFICFSDIFFMYTTPHMILPPCPDSYLSCPSITNQLPVLGILSFVFCDKSSTS